MTVLPSDTDFSARMTIASVAESRFAVISSSSKIGGCAATARAIERSWHCPHEKLVSEETKVS